MYVTQLHKAGMPGGKDYRRWYAMRKAMQERGKWKGKQPTHSVPQQEEGEPPAKTSKGHGWYSKTIAGADLAQSEDDWTPPHGWDTGAPYPPQASTSAADPDDEPPPLEASPTPEGRCNGVKRVQCAGMGQTRITTNHGCVRGGKGQGHTTITARFQLSNWMPVEYGYAYYNDR